MAAALLDWLDAIALPGGAVPFALPGAASAGSAPMWDGADTTSPSLHMTAVVLGIAHRVARTERAVAAHSWLRRATAWALAEIAALDGPRDAIEFRYVLQLLDALEASHELERLDAHLPADGTLAVSGGKPDEGMRPLDFSPEPNRSLRALLDPLAVEADLDRLEAEQHDDGGWDVDWARWSPAGGLEWRGWATGPRGSDPACERPPLTAPPTSVKSHDNKERGKRTMGAPSAGPESRIVLEGVRVPSYLITRARA